VVEPTPLQKYELASWDDDMPNINGEIIQMFQTTNQPAFISKFPLDTEDILRYLQIPKRKNILSHHLIGVFHGEKSCQVPSF